MLGLQTTATNPVPIAGTPKMENSLVLGHSSDWWNGFMLLSLGLAAFVAVLVVVATTGVVVATKREAAAAEEELRAYRATADGKIADAKSEGIEAGKMAGNALLKAAALEKEAEELRAANLSLQLQVQPRRLSGDSSSKLVEALSKVNPLPIGIVSRMLDPEGADFADDLSAAFAKANWQQVRQRDWTMSNKGVAIATLEGTSIAPDLAKAMVSALAAAHIKATVTTIRQSEQNTTSAHFQPNVLYLLVGAKP